MASKAPGKTAKKTKAKAKTTAARSPTRARPRASARPARSAPRTGATPVPRALILDDEDGLLATGAGIGTGFGRCGGRVLGSRLEQAICDRLGQAGVAHSHTPRHFEVRLEGAQVAAYAPMVVLRGRGREGKSVVIEALEDEGSPLLRKIIAFRTQYGQEFYVILVAPDDVLDEVPLSAHDEACSATNVSTLVARLAE